MAELHTALAEDALRDAADAAGSESADEADEAPSGPSWARMLSQVSSVAEGMELLALRAPEVYFLNGARIEPMLSKKSVCMCPNCLLWPISTCQRFRSTCRHQTATLARTCDKTNARVSHSAHSA